MLLAAVRVLALTGGRGSTRVPIYSLTSIERWIETLPEQDRKLLLEYDVEAEFWRDCALSDAQRAGIDHSRTVKPNAYLGCKPSYDRATFDRISLALNSASPPSLSVIAKAEGLSKQAVFRLKENPEAALAALDAWGM